MFVEFPIRNIFGFVQILVYNFNHILIWQLSPAVTTIQLQRHLLIKQYNNVLHVIGVLIQIG